MANLDQAPSRSMPNLLHVLPAFADEAEREDGGLAGWWGATGSWNRV